VDTMTVTRGDQQVQALVATWSRNAATGAPVYKCPVEECVATAHTADGISRHARLAHQVLVVGPRGGGEIAPSGSAAKRGTRSKGTSSNIDVSPIGPQPSEPVYVAICNCSGTEVKRFRLYVLPISDVVDTVAGALRQAVEMMPGKVRR